MSYNNSSLWVIGVQKDPGASGYQVWQRVGMGWQKRNNGLSEGALRITVDSYNRPWVITGNKTIKYWNFAQNKFLSIGSSKTATDLTILDENVNSGAYALYICSTEPATNGGYKIYKYIGGSNWYLYSHEIGGHRIGVDVFGNPAIVKYTNPGSSYETGDLYLWDRYQSRFRIISPYGYKVHEIDNICRSSLIFIAATDDPGENDSHIFCYYAWENFSRDPVNFKEYAQAPDNGKYYSFTFDNSQENPGWSTASGTQTYEWLPKISIDGDATINYVSSEYHPVYYCAENVLDNNSSTKWNSGYKIPEPHEVIIDLGWEQNNIGSVEILHAGSELQKYITKDYTIETSNDLVNWTIQANIVGNTSNNPFHHFSSFVEAKYVKLKITNAGELYARIYTVNVYGYKY